MDSSDQNTISGSIECGTSPYNDNELIYKQTKKEIKKYFVLIILQPDYFRVWQHDFKDTQEISMVLVTNVQ